MLPFFRKIRYRLAKDNQFFKYSRYAIGEIVLVVVGILIALYINNWNEKRKLNNRFNEALIQVESELIFNIQSCQDRLLRLNNIDQKIGHILWDSLTIDDYRKDPSLVYSISSYQNTKILDQAFRHLLSIEKVYDTEQDSILNYLKNIYDLTKIDIERYAIRTEQDIMTLEDSFKTKSWYFNYKIHDLNDEIFTFFMSDQVFKNNLLEYSIQCVRDNRRSVESFELDALKAYRMIYKYLEKNKLQHNDSLFFTYDVEDFRHFIGVYVPFEYPSGMYWDRVDSIKVFIKGNLLYHRPHFENGNEHQFHKKEMVIRPRSKTFYTHDRRTGYYNLMFNENDEVTGITLSGGNGRIKLKKIR